MADIFIHIPKTGGSSIYKAGYPDIIRYKKHETGLFVKDSISPEEWDNAYKVAWVRNPWQRVVSLWKWTKKWDNHNYEEFKPWLFDPQVNREYMCEDTPYNRSPLPALTYLADLKGNLLVDFIGKLESWGYFFAPTMCYWDNMI